MKKIVVKHAQKSLRAGRGERKITGCEQVRFPSLDLILLDSLSFRFENLYQIKPRLLLGELLILFVNTKRCSPIRYPLS